MDDILSGSILVGPYGPPMLVTAFDPEALFAPDETTAMVADVNPVNGDAWPCIPRLLGPPDPPQEPKSG